MKISNASAYSRLSTLHDKYCSTPDNNYFDNWINLVKKYAAENKKTLIDIAIDAANISHTISEHPEKLNDPLVISAIHDTVPSFDFNAPLTGAALEGALNTAKGKFFEYLVADKLNSGDRVGSVVLPEGYTAKLAESANQPGWDIQILDQNSRTAEYLQLKATDSAAYIKDALDRYPEITILTTEEALYNNHYVIGSDISNSDLEKTVLDAMNGQDASIDEAFLDAFNPLLSLAFIAGTEGFKLSVSNDDINQVKLSMSHRMTRSLMSQSLGALVYAVGVGWLALPTTILTGYMYEQMARNYETSTILNNVKDSLVLLRIEQQEKHFKREY